MLAFLRPYTERVSTLGLSVWSSALGPHDRLPRWQKTHAQIKTTGAYGLVHLSRSFGHYNNKFKKDANIYLFINYSFISVSDISINDNICLMSIKIRC